MIDTCTNSDFVRDHAPSQSYIKAANYCNLLHNIHTACGVKASKWTYVNMLDDSLTTGHLTDMFC